MFSKFNIFQVLQNILQIHDTSVEIMILKCSVLKSLANKCIGYANQNTVFDLIIELFKNVLRNSNPLVKQHALQTFSFFAHHTVHEPILSHVVNGVTKLREDFTNYLQQIVPNASLSSWEYFKKHQSTLRHQCCVVNNVEPALKRPKLMSNINLEAVVQRLKNDVNDLVEFSRWESLSEGMQNDLMQIAGNIQRLLNN